MSELIKQFIKTNIKLTDCFSFDSPAIKFRRKFFAKKGKRAFIYVCGLGYGYFYLNGQRISEDMFTAPVSDYKKRVWYNKYDITGLIVSGENVISAIAGNGFYNENFNSGWNHNRAEWRDTPKIFVCLEIDDEVVLISDEKFVWKEDECIFFNQLRSGEYWNYNYFDDWTALNYSDDDWHPAVLDENENTGILTECKCEPVRECAEYKTLRIIKNGGKYVFDIGQNISGYVRVKGKFGKDQELTLRYSEEIDDIGNLVLNNLEVFTKEAPFQTDKIIGNGESIEWSPLFTYHGFRFVEISGLRESPLPDMITGIFVHQDIKCTSTFECSSDVLNGIYKLGIMSTYSNMLYALTDCPTREKLGWMNDAAASADQVLIDFDCAEFLKKWMTDIFDSMKEDGSVPGIAPSCNWGYEVGGVCTVAVAEIPYRLYLKTNDRKIIDTALPFIEKHFAYFEKRIKDDNSGFTLGDWTGITQKETPIPFIEKFLALRFLRVIIAFRKLSGLDDLVYSEKYKEFKRKIAEKYLCDGGSIYNNQTAVSMLLVENIGEKDILGKQLYDLIEKKPAFDCGMVGIQYIYDALTGIGRADLAVTLLTNKNSFYKRWLDEGATTMYESFDKNPYTLSKNHHMFSNVIAWFFRCILGIKYDRIDGVDKITVEPCFEVPLEYARGSITLKKGTVFVEWIKENGKITCNVKADENMNVKYRGNS